MCFEQQGWVSSRICIQTMDVLIKNDSNPFVKDLRDSLRKIAALFARGPVNSVLHLLKATL